MPLALCQRRWFRIPPIGSITTIESPDRVAYGRRTRGTKGRFLLSNLNPSFNPIPLHLIIYMYVAQPSLDGHFRKRGTDHHWFVELCHTWCDLCILTHYIHWGMCWMSTIIIKPSLMCHLPVDVEKNQLLGHDHATCIIVWFGELFHPAYHLSASIFFEITSFWGLYDLLFQTLDHPPNAFLTLVVGTPLVVVETFFRKKK